MLSTQSLIYFPNYPIYFAVQCTIISRPLSKCLVQRQFSQCLLAVVSCVKGKSVKLGTQWLPLAPLCFSYGAPLAPVLSSYTPEASDLQVGSLVLINSLYDNVGALRAIPSEKPLFLEAYPIQLLPIIYVKDVLLKKNRQNFFLFFLKKKTL